MRKHEPHHLAHPNIPQPLHGLAPRVVLGQQWWDIEKRKAKQDNEDHCLTCGVHRSEAMFHQWLEGHETYDIDYDQATMTYIKTIPLCHACHNFIHSGRLWMMLQEKEVTEDFVKRVIIHGMTICIEHNIKPFWVAYEVAKEMGAKNLPKPWEPKAGPRCTMNDWCLVIDGQKYYP